MKIKRRVIIFSFLICNITIISASTEITKLIEHSTGNSLIPVLISLVGEFIKSISPSILIPIMTVIINVADTITDVLLPPPTIPHLPQDKWWGDNNHNKDTSIRRCDIKLKPERIKRLLHKLDKQENFTKPLEGSAFTYGTNTDFQKYFLHYWQYEYDFEAAQERIFRYPQFVTNIQGLDVTFVHVKPKIKGKKVLPLLLLHGWPLNSIEFNKLIPELMKPRRDKDFVFEVVAPSYPGFGYSEPTFKIGLTPYQVGIILKNLMNRLGFKKFYIHGGDVGGFVGADMATMFQDDILGYHTNLAFSFLPRTLVKYFLGSLYPPAVVKPKYSNRMYPISSRLYYYITKFGYFHMQATFPDNLGASLTDSPAAIASWLLSPVAWATNPHNINYNDGRIFDIFKKEDIGDFFTVMWDAEYLQNSIRMYAETTGFSQDPTILKIMMNPTKVPFAAIKFRHEIIYLPDKLLRDKYPNLCHSTTVDSGGHLAAYENFKILGEDIWNAVDEMRLCKNKYSILDMF